ncbi:MAG: hypothetical protein KDC90_12920 [Ignavibacteriae bacterium]|nr:hypothetical protein [Ignavibacteriota bacterium]
MNIQNEKNKLIEWIKSLSDENIIERIMVVKESQNSDWWNELSNFERKSIDSGIADIKKGEVHQHSKVKKLYEKWL